MKTKVRFYKNEDNNWYADVPGHTLEENEMVMGSDAVLEMISNGNKAIGSDAAFDMISNGKDEVILEVSDEPIVDYLAHFHMTEHDEDGASYESCGNADILGEIWICNVTHDVLGEHPEDIYIKYIDKNEN